MTDAPERLYQMIRIKAGDYLLPSNDGKRLWRIYQYEDGPSHGLSPLDMKRDVTLWACAYYDGTIEQAYRDDDLTAWSSMWIQVESWLRTRAEAIDEAMKFDVRRPAR